VSVFYVPWWVLLACSLASAVATYLILRRTQAGHSAWALFPLTVVLAPVVLGGLWLRPSPSRRCSPP
jgi:ABC-type molybdate transport system permease subunit